MGRKSKEEGIVCMYQVFQGGEVFNNPPASTGDFRDVGSMIKSGRSPGGGDRNPLQYSCQDDSMDRGAWQATVCRVAKKLDNLAVKQQ